MKKVTKRFILNIPITAVLKKKLNELKAQGYNQSALCRNILEKSLLGKGK